MEIPNLVKKKEEIKNKGIPLINTVFVLTLIMASIAVGYFFGKKTPSKQDSELGNSNQVKQNNTNSPLSMQQVGSVLGTMTSGAEKTIQDAIARFTATITNTASESAEHVSNTLFDSTVGTVLKQIDKLPPKQQEDIRRNICK